jgi:hypothetical protein
MRLDALSNKELEKLAEAFSKSEVMLKKRKGAEKFFNSPQFLEFIKERQKRYEDEEKKNGTNEFHSE